MGVPAVTRQPPEGQLRCPPLHHSALRSDKQPCQAFAIVGGRVCRAHGGSAPQVRQAARLRAAEAPLWRGFQRDWSRYEAAVREWQIDRIVTVAELTGKRPCDIDSIDIVLCAREHGRPVTPRPEFRTDRRVGRRR
jgi:hypothetical protein